MEQNVMTKAPEGVSDAERVFYDRLRQLQEAQGGMRAAGKYFLVPTEALTRRANAFFSKYHDNVAKLLESSGIDADTINAVLQDYALILSGFFDVQLPLLKQEEVTKKVNPSVAFLTERYGLNLLFSVYSYNLMAANDYIGAFKHANGNVVKVTTDKDGKRMEEKMTVDVEEQKDIYLATRIKGMQSEYPPMRAGGYQWIRTHGTERDGEPAAIVELADFEGITPERTNKFLLCVEVYTSVSDYVNFWFLSTYAYGATAEELAEIAYPPIFKDFESAREYAEWFAQNRYQNIQREAERIADILTATTEDSRKKALRETTGGRPDATIAIPNKILMLCSKPLNVSYTEEMRPVITIKKAIENAKDNGEIQKSSTVDAEDITRTVLGLVKLRNFNNSPARDNFYIYRTSITKFSRDCGYRSADSDELEKIYDSLKVLNKLYVIFWEPENGGAKKSKKPNARPQMVKVARQLLMIPELRVNDNVGGNDNVEYFKDKIEYVKEIEFRVAAVAFDLKEGKTYISQNKLFAMIVGAKKISQYRFFCQLLAKTNIKEEDLLDQVFGYSARLEEAKYNQDAYECVKENILRHKSRNKKQIQKWAAKYVEEGILAGFESHKNPQGEIVLTWRKGNVTAKQIEECKKRLKPNE